MFEKEIICFNFRLIDLPGDLQVIDEFIKTPIDALTPEMQMEYMEVHEQLTFVKKLQKKERMEEVRKRKVEERNKKLARNPFYRLACLCGMV